jgi:hypothetical protein
LICWTCWIDSHWCHIHQFTRSTPNSLNMHAMWILNSPTIHNTNAFASKEIYKVTKCAYIQTHLKKVNQLKSMCVCALCSQKKHWVVYNVDVEQWTCTQHWCQTHKQFAKCTHIQCTQRKKKKEFHLCLCIVHYAFKETSELCTILMLSNEHACNACRNPSLGFVAKARACKGAGQEWARKSHFMFSGVQESGREWPSTLPSELPLWELKSRWTLESSESNFKGQNPLD